MPERAHDAWYGVHNGFEVQIDSAGDEWHRTGAIYSLSRSTQLAQNPQGEWNTMDIELAGPITRVTLNGKLVNEFDPSKPVPERKQHYEPTRGPRPDYGYIGLQNHDANSVVYFKEVSVIDSAKTIDKGERDRIMSYFHSTRKRLLDQVDGLSDAQWNLLERRLQPGLAAPLLQQRVAPNCRSSLQASTSRKAGCRGQVRSSGLSQVESSS